MTSANRRLVVVLAVVALGIAPAAVLRALCVGRSCEREADVRPRVPFCSLPDEIRDLLIEGFRDRRSPNVLAVTGDVAVRGSTALPDARWPASDPSEDVDAMRVPLVFAGAGVRTGARVPGGTTLDAVAPTVADGIGLRRPHPAVRSGVAIPGVASGERPRLVVLVAWRGVGTKELAAARRGWPTLRDLMRRGAGTRDASVGSLPLDPAAALTTIGTGGLPRDHGMTGTLVRNDDGRLVEAWGPGLPYAVIAALGDDLDASAGQRARVGVVGTDVSDRGLVGGTWYVEGDRDDVEIVDRGGPRKVVTATSRLLATGYGRDAIPDLLGVALEGEVRDLDAALAGLVTASDRAAGGSAMVVVAGTGSATRRGVPAERMERRVEAALGAGDVVEATAVGGAFVNQGALADQGLTADRVVQAFREVRGPDGRPLLADVFPSIAVTFAKYC